MDQQWKAFAIRSMAAPKAWMDAYLAAFSVAGGFELVTIDADFTQHDGLRLHLLTGQ